jgi:hypothetical protein
VLKNPPLASVPPVLIVMAGDGYTYNVATSTFAQIADVDFTGATTVAYLDGFFVYNLTGTKKVWVTAFLDGTSVEPFAYRSAVASPDGVVAVKANGDELWVFGKSTTEVWYNAGEANFPFAPIQGEFTEAGCIAPFSVAKAENTLFWLGGDQRGQGIVYRAKGFTGERISTHAVEWQIQQYGDISDAIAYTYQQDGHTFYVITFPGANGNATWAYDVTTGAWHERANYGTGSFTRHRGNCQAFIIDDSNTPRNLIGD